MRVTTDFWVSALVKRTFSGGGFAAIVRKGSLEAGAIFIVCRDRMGGIALYAPAPQTSYDTAKPDDRFFVLHELADDGTLENRLEKEARFDPDIWVVEIEPGREPIAKLISIAES